MTEVAIDSEPDRVDEWEDKIVEDVFENAPDASPAVREFVTSGGLSTVGGLLTLGQGLKALRRGKTGRGLLGAVAGGLFVAIGIGQLRSRFGRSGRDVDQTDVVGVGSNVEDVDTLGSEEDDRDRGGIDPTEIAETGPDIEDVGGRSDAPDEGRDRRDDTGTEVVDEGLDGESTGVDDHDETATNDTEQSPDESRHD